MMFPLISKCTPRLSSATARTQVRGVVTSARELYNAYPKVEGVIEVPSKIEKTQLEGGCNVVSLDIAYPLTTLSVYVNAGTRYETRQTSTASAYLKHLAFRGTNEKSALRLTRDIEHIGANLNSEISRDHIAYHVKGLRIPNSPSLDIIAETLRFVLNPLILEHEVEATREILLREAASAQSDYRERVFDLLHAEAFRDSGLSNALLPSSARIKQVQPIEIYTHVKNSFYPGNRITIVGTGVDHSVLLEKVKPLFTKPELKGRFRELKGQSLPPEAATPQSASFVGSGINVRLTESTDTHVGVAFPGFSSSSGDLLSAQVLTELLNNGQNGIRQALAGFSWVKSVEAVHLDYSDSGLLVVYAHAEPGHGAELASTLFGALKKFPSSISQTDVEISKRRVQHAILKDALNCRFKLAKQLASKGATPQELVNGLDQVNLAKVAKTLGVQPALVSLGDVRGVPRF